MFCPAQAKRCPVVRSHALVYTWQYVLTSQALCLLPITTWGLVDWDLVIFLGVSNSFSTPGVLLGHIIETTHHIQPVYFTWFQDNQHASGQGCVKSICNTQETKSGRKNARKSSCNYCCYTRGRLSQRSHNQHMQLTVPMYIWTRFGCFYIRRWTAIDATQLIKQ